MLQSTETPRAAHVLLLPKEEIFANQKMTEHTFPNDAKHFGMTSLIFLSIFVFGVEIQTAALLLPKRKLILQGKSN